jgi:hypothetical protein
VLTKIADNLSQTLLLRRRLENFCTSSFIDTPQICLTLFYRIKLAERLARAGLHDFFLLGFRERNGVVT